MKHYRIKGDNIRYYNKYRHINSKMIICDMNSINQFYQNGYFTNGNYIIKINKTPKNFNKKIIDKIEERDDRDIIRYINEFSSNICSAKIIAETFDCEGFNPYDRIFIHIQTENNKNYMFDPKYIDHILTIYPESKLFINEENDCLFFKNNEEIVACTMPIRIKKNESAFELDYFTEYQLKRYKELT